MADVLLSPDPNTSSSINNSLNNSTPSSKKRLNWLSWMRKSLNIGKNHRNKLCACGLHHGFADETKPTETSSTDENWPVFTTQMSQSGRLVTSFNN